MAQLKPCSKSGHRPWTAATARRSCWRALAPVRDDSNAGPGPSSIAAAAFASARSSTMAARKASRSLQPSRTAAEARRLSFTSQQPVGRRHCLPSSLAAVSEPPPTNDSDGAGASNPNSNSNRRAFKNRRNAGSTSGAERKSRAASSSSRTGAHAKHGRSEEGASGSGSDTGGGAAAATAPLSLPQTGAVESHPDPSPSASVDIPITPTSTGLTAAGADAASPATADAVQQQEASSAALPAARPVKSILEIAAAGESSSRSRTQRGTAAGGAAAGGAAAAGAAAAAAAASGGGGGATEGAAEGFPLRLPDGRQLVLVKEDTVAAGAASALSHALGVEQRAVVRFNGGVGGLKGMRVLTLANIFMGNFQRALSFVVDVKQVLHGRMSPLEGRPQSGDVSYMYRVRARSRDLEPHDKQLPAALRHARFLLDLSINVRQAWDMKGDVDEDQAYDLADTLYGALLAQQAEEDAAEAAAEAALQRRQEQAQLQLQQEQRHQQLQHDVGARGHKGPMGQRYSPDDLNLDHVRDLGFAVQTAEEQKRETHDGREQWRRRWQQQQQEQQRRLQPPPWIMVTADLAQGLTIVTALGLLQKRLREEQQQGVVETTLYRASVAAPRLNGKDGWVFAIRLGFETPYLPAWYGNRTGARRLPPSSSSSSSSLSSPLPAAIQHEQRSSPSPSSLPYNQRRSRRQAGGGGAAAAAATTPAVAGTAAAPAPAAAAPLALAGR